MERQTRNRIYRTAQALITAMFVLDLIGIWYLDHLFIYERPSKPGGPFDIEFPSHGSSTFITNSDHRLYILAWVALFGLLATSGLVYQFSRTDWRRIAGQKTPL